MRGLSSLACIVLCFGVCFSAPQTEEGEATTTATTTTQDTETTEATTTTTTTTAIAIKHINEINDDGSYTVGFEASDGTFKLETRDLEGNVEGKYGYLNDDGEVVTIEYSSNNSTGFTTDVQAAPQQVVEEDPAFAQERARHAAVLKHQESVVAKQKEIQEQNVRATQRQSFANQQRGRRPVFNAAAFNPRQSIAGQFDQNTFNQDFNNFNRQQQQQQLAPQQQFAPQQQQQFAPQQQQQFVPQQQFAPQQQFVPQQQQQFAPQQQQQFVPQQQFAPQQQQQFAPQQQQQFAPQQQQQFAPQQQKQFVPQQQQQQFFAQQQQFVPEQPRQSFQLTPASQLTAEQVALEGFSRDEDQDGQIDPLPAHLQQQFAPQQQFVPQQQQQFAPQQPQQFAPQQQQQFAPQQFPSQEQQQFLAGADKSFQNLQQFQQNFFRSQQQQQAAPQFAPQQQQAAPQFAPQQQQAAPQQQQFRAPRPVASRPVGQVPQLTTAQLAQLLQQQGA